MGAKVSKHKPDAPAAVRIVLPGGRTETYFRHVSAQELMLRHPRHLVALPPEMCRSDIKKALVPPEVVLVPGRTFYLVPHSMVKRKLYRQMISDSMGNDASQITIWSAMFKSPQCCRRKPVAKRHARGWHQAYQAWKSPIRNIKYDERPTRASPKVCPREGLEQDFNIVHDIHGQEDNVVEAEEAMDIEKEPANEAGQEPNVVGAEEAVDIEKEPANKAGQEENVVEAEEALDIEKKQVNKAGQEVCVVKAEEAMDIEKEPANKVGQEENVVKAEEAMDMEKEPANKAVESSTTPAQANKAGQEVNVVKAEEAMDMEKEPANKAVESSTAPAQANKAGQEVNMVKAEEAMDIEKEPANKAVESSTTLAPSQDDQHSSVGDWTDSKKGGFGVDMPCGDHVPSVTEVRATGLVVETIGAEESEPICRVQKLTDDIQEMKLVPQNPLNNTIPELNNGHEVCLSLEEREDPACLTFLGPCTDHCETDQKETKDPQKNAVLGQIDTSDASQFDEFCMEKKHMQSKVLVKLHYGDREPIKTYEHLDKAETAEKAPGHDETAETGAVQTQAMEWPDGGSNKVLEDPAIATVRVHHGEDFDRVGVLVQSNENSHCVSQSSLFQEDQVSSPQALSELRNSQIDGVLCISADKDENRTNTTIQAEVEVIELLLVSIPMEVEGEKTTMPDVNNYDCIQMTVDGEISATLKEEKHEALSLSEPKDVNQNIRGQGDVTNLQIYLFRDDNHEDDTLQHATKESEKPKSEKRATLEGSFSQPFPTLEHMINHRSADIKQGSDNGSSYFMASCSNHTRPPDKQIPASSIKFQVRGQHNLALLGFYDLRKDNIGIIEQLRLHKRADRISHVIRSHQLKAHQVKDRHELQEQEESSQVVANSLLLQHRHKLKEQEESSQVVANSLRSPSQPSVGARPFRLRKIRNFRYRRAWRPLSPIIETSPEIYLNSPAISPIITSQPSIAPVM